MKTYKTSTASSYIYEVSEHETDILGSGITVSNIKYTHDETKAFKLLKTTSRNYLVRISKTQNDKLLRETYLYEGCWEKSY